MEGQIGLERKMLILGAVMCVGAGRGRQCRSVAGRGLSGDTAVGALVQKLGKSLSQLRIQAASLHTSIHPGTCPAAATGDRQPRDEWVHQSSLV